MKLIVILTYLAAVCYEFILDYLNYKNRNAPLPDNVKDVYDEETYVRRSQYSMEHLRLDIFSSMSTTVLSLLYLTLNVHNYLFNVGIGFTPNLYLQTGFMMGAVMLLELLIGIPFNVVSTFKIEQKYGFNKSTVKTFIGDIIKQLLILAVVGFGLLSLFIWLYGKIGDTVFSAFFFVLVGLSVILNFFFHVFSKIFNKFKPLEDGMLKTKVEELARKTGYSVKRIFVMDASKRSTKINAYFAGFGRNKTIVLYDTMLESLSEDEIIGILAHELGHFKKKHTVLNFVLGLVSMAILLLGAQFIVTQEAVSAAFGFEEPNLAFGMLVFFVLYAPVAKVLAIPRNIISRKFEYAADKFAAEYADKEAFISSLKKIHSLNYANLSPHPLVVLASYSHPPLMATA